MAKAKKPHSIRETLKKPCFVSCASILLGKSVLSKMKQVSLSNDTVKSHIFNMSCNIKLQLCTKVKVSLVFAIQLDESVDVVNLSQLIVLVRYVHDQSIKENLLFCCPLETTSQAANVMQLVDAFQGGKIGLGQTCPCLHRWGSCYVRCEVWIRKTTEAEESQGGDPALHHTSKSAWIKDDDTTAQRST